MVFTALTQKMDGLVIASRNRLLSNSLDVESIISNAETKAKSNDAIQELNGKVDEFGGGAYGIVSKAVFFCLLIAFLLCIAKLAFSNSQNRTEAKSDIVIKILALVLFVSLVGMFIFAGKLNLFS